MSNIKLKKSLGQHFLHDREIISRISDAIGSFGEYASVVEVGPGAGALTSRLIEKEVSKLWLVELDDHWQSWLKNKYPMLKDRIVHEDFLKTDILSRLPGPIHLVGNFPYNISSQIVFKAMEHTDNVRTVSGMFQKEMALRIASPPESKDYGVISVLAQVFFEVEYLFDISPDCFDPPPKVVSGFIRMSKRKESPIQSNFPDFSRVVKAAFSQRRKTLRNSLAPLWGKQLPEVLEPLLGRRPETLSLQEFDFITQTLSVK